MRRAVFENRSELRARYATECLFSLCVSARRPHAHLTTSDLARITVYVGRDVLDTATGGSQFFPNFFIQKHVINVEVVNDRFVYFVQEWSARERTPAEAGCPWTIGI
jgi:hypothetical protein